MHAAIVKLNTLTDAIGTSAQNHSSLLIRGADLGIAQLVRLIVILSKALELGSASVNCLKNGDNTQFFTTSAYRELVRPSQVSNLVIGKTELFGRKHIFSRKLIKPALGNRALNHDNVSDTIQEPAIDLIRFKNLIYRPATSERLSNIKNAVFSRTTNQFSKMVLIEGVLAVAAQAVATILKGAHCLAKCLFERTADCHNLANGLHTSGKRGISALEFLERKTRDLDYAIVDSGLKASRGCLCDVIGNLVKRIPYGKLCGSLSDRESSCLRSQCR